MKSLTVILGALAATILSISVASAGATATRSYVKGNYNFTCMLKNPKTEMCGNWKVLK